MRNLKLIHGKHLLDEDAEKSCLKSAPFAQELMLTLQLGTHESKLFTSKKIS